MIAENIIRLIILLTHKEKMWGLLLCEGGGPFVFYKNRDVVVGSRMMENCGKYWVFVIGMCVMLGVLIGCGSGKKNDVVKNSIVQVKAGDVVGSGIVFEKKEDSFVVLTAGHVVQGMPETVAVVFQDEEAESTTYTISKTSDIAFVLVPAEAVSAELWKNISVVEWDKESFDALIGGEQMTVQGILEDGSSQELLCDLIYPWIYTEDFAQYMMLLRGEILPGMSGGGVFDEAGRLVGILCGVSEEREIAVLPLSIILAEYSLVYG